jgi:hypothetical protein
MRAAHNILTVSFQLSELQWMQKLETCSTAAAQIRAHRLHQCLRACVSMHTAFGPPPAADAVAPSATVHQVLKP